jgi:hypothetical protein
MKSLVVLLAVLVPTIAFADYRTGPAMYAGKMEGDPAIALALEIEEPRSRLHLRPRFGVWKQDGEPGIWEIGLDAYWHVRECHVISPYAGVGIGAEWLPDLPIENDGDDVPPDPRAGDDPPTVDPPQPIASFFGGIRFPGNRADVFVEARFTVGVDDRERAGVFAGLGFHPARKR